MAIPEKAFLSPVRFATANPTIRVTNGIGDTSNIAISVLADTDYWISGDSQTDDLLYIIKTDMNAVMGAWGVYNDVLITADARNIITLNFDNAVDIQWSHAGTTFDPTLIGFLAVDTGSGDPHVSPDASQGFWYPGTSTNPRAPRNADPAEPVGVTDIAESSDGSSRGYYIGPSDNTDKERAIFYHHIDKSKARTDDAAADEPYGSAEYNWENFWRKGAPIRVYENKETRVAGGWTQWRLQNPRRPWSLMDGRLGVLRRYNVDLQLREVAS